ncbi:hypothetical protein AGLY_005616 [Aphis glycines]|uniref:Uncharacterized protein n=1 Tax=Aphis glycines TaxID=307491 RepID=A0A6G0TVN2_APHGL|nr:hypothetical protein AGLY_005616 [Aphis glycines]
MELRTFHDDSCLANARQNIGRILMNNQFIKLHLRSGNEKKKDQIFNISATNHFSLALFHHIIITDVYECTLNTWSMGDGKFKTTNFAFKLFIWPLKYLYHYGKLIFMKYELFIVTVTGVMHSCTSCGVGGSTYTKFNLSASGNDGCVSYNRNGDLDGSHLNESTILTDFRIVYNWIYKYKGHVHDSLSNVIVLFNVDEYYFKVGGGALATKGVTSLIEKRVGNSFSSGVTESPQTDLGSFLIIRIVKNAKRHLYQELGP